MISGRQMEDIFWEAKIEYDDLFKKKQYDIAWEECLKVWEKFPNPKYKEPMSYLWIEDIINHAIETKQFELANKYIGFLFIADLERCDIGDREYLAGKLAFEQGEIELAKQLFRRAYEKEPSGMCFKGKENEKYRNLIKDHNKTKKNLTNDHLSSEKLLSKGEKYLALKKYDKAEELFQRAIDKMLAQSEEEKNMIYRNGYSGLGDCYFAKNNFKVAKDYFLDAYNYDYENAYINMRIGQCFVNLDEQEKAKEYLIKAYMIDGEDVFEGEEKYLDIIRNIIE